MTGPAAGSDLGFLDGRDYRLIVTMDHDRHVVVEHQHADDRIARRDMTRLAAEIVDEVGPAAVAAALGADDVPPARLVRGAGVVVMPPQPGIAVLGCRCGRAIDTAELAWLTTTRPHKAGSAFPRIVCSRCASA